MIWRFELDNERERARFLSEIPCLSAEEVANAAGRKGRNDSTASRWKSQGRILSVPHEGKEFYPRFQFKDGEPIPTIAKALAALPARMTPWQRAFWLTSGNGWLSGRTPADMLGREELVEAAAKREAEEIVG